MSAIGRRTFLGGAVAAAAACATSRARAFEVAWDEDMPRAPIAFVAHGSPALAVDPIRGPELRAWGQEWPAIRGILSITPHYRAPRIELGAIGPGVALRTYPRRFLPDVGELRYPSPTNETLASRVKDVLQRASHDPASSDRRGLDHTTWMPLLHLQPAAAVPVLEIALPFVADRELFELGRALSPLRYESVVLLASGNLTHNLAMLGTGDAVAPWAREFDSWVAATLARGDLDALVDWRRAAPTPYLAHPDDGGHFDVLLVALGYAAASGNLASVRFPVEGFEEGSLSKRCVEIG